MKEQIEKQAIEEMAKVIERTEHIAEEMVGARPSPTMYAKDLYWHGYRKQSEGVWIYNPDGIDWGLGAWQCSLCGCNNHNLPQDKGTNPLIWAGGKYCPNCGANMKGGTDEAPQKHFSPEDVRKMSPREVRENYTAIMESMKEWK